MFWLDDSIAFTIVEKFFEGAFQIGDGTLLQRWYAKYAALSVQSQSLPPHILTPTTQKNAISNLPIAMPSGAQVYNQIPTLTKDAVDVFDVVDDEYVTFRPSRKQPRKEVRRIFRACLDTASTLHFALSSTFSN